MHTVIETPAFLASGIPDEERAEIVRYLAENPTAGKIMSGTGGARKLRFAMPGQGKSGSYRTVHYFGGDDVPVFLLVALRKNERAELSQAEKNALKMELQGLADDYRASVRSKIKKTAKRK